MTIPYNLLSSDAQVALTEFAAQFMEALAASPVNQWAKLLGLYHPSKMLKTTWPVPVSGAGYEEIKGDLRYRKLAEKSFDLLQKTWQDGVEELASVIEAPDFIGWVQEPQRMAGEAAALPNSIIAGLLEANGTCWDGENFFDTDHPVNVFDAGEGTFQNTTSSAGLSLTTLETAKTNFRKLKKPGKNNGTAGSLGLRMTHLLVPPDLEETARDLVERQLIVVAGASTDAAVDNRHRGSVQLVVADELTDTNDWFALALNKPGLYPWVCQDTGSLESIINDKSSDHYKRTLKVSFASIFRGNGGLALPHCIHRYQG